MPNMINMGCGTPKCDLSDEIRNASTADSTYMHSKVSTGCYEVRLTFVLDCERLFSLSREAYRVRLTDRHLLSTASSSQTRNHIGPEVPINSSGAVGTPPPH